MAQRKTNVISMHYPLSSLALAILLLGASVPAMAQKATHGLPVLAHHFLDQDRAKACIAQAASYHGVDERLLRAVFAVESGTDLNPFAVSKNSNGSVDIGMAQINSQHWPQLAKMGIKPEQLYDPCVASFVGAWMLKKNIDTHGLTWQGVARYHSATPALNQRYQARLYAALEREMKKPQKTQPFVEEEK